MTTFKSNSTATVAKKNFISIKEESQDEINQIHNFSKINLGEQKTFIGEILASKSNKQNKKDLVASDNFYSNTILSSKKQTPTQSAEPATEKEQAVEETKETPTQSAEPATEKEQAVEETKETPTQSAENPQVTEEGKSINGV